MFPHWPGIGCLTVTWRDHSPQPDSDLWSACGTERGRSQRTRAGHPRPSVTATSKASTPSDWQLDSQDSLRYSHSLHRVYRSPYRSPHSASWCSRSRGSYSKLGMTEKERDDDGFSCFSSIQSTAEEVFKALNSLR